MRTLRHKINFCVSLRGASRYVGTDVTTKILIRLALPHRESYWWLGCCSPIVLQIVSFRD